MGFPGAGLKRCLEDNLSSGIGIYCGHATHYISPVARGGMNPGPPPPA